MKLVLLFESIWLMALLTCTREIPLDQPLEEMKGFDSKSGSLDIDWKSRSIKDEEINLRNRWNHSRMLMMTSTTLKFDEWWFFTTKRPIIFYKDYPGKPGVATWKEISPTDNRGSRKLKNPTAEQVSSCSWSLSSNLRHSMVYAIAGILMGLYYIRQ